ncbi:UvrD-helicase domain-containing protein [Chitinophaga sp. LS1]|uniref:UvrD-helicase domain-containing protein n=1 Tax=Chitinophaga sp. LS1 TaxID=3051176 RepID=UPI002AAB4841|nr:UvrD-helicase domain-containing protein [Chitinophaga sp. LS1]WPV67121.1 UvrD-helicase domain-containing protein [Chitinophaga sp. LS1]
MSKDMLISWLRNQQPKLEKILCKSAEEYYGLNVSQRNFSYCTKQSCQELWLLNDGKDLCYDRPTIGFSYSLWYHPKRINTFLEYFTDLIYASLKEGSIEIFDLGAGTGAVQWAVGLIIQGLKELRLQCPKIRVINVDTSAFMISYNYHFLWKYFVQEYPAAQDISKNCDYQLNSWTNIDSGNYTNIWICASYLFDHSDNANEIVSEFKLIIENYKPNKVILLSSYHKRKHCDAVASELRKLNFNSYLKTITQPVFSGSLQQLYSFRDSISQKHNLNMKGIPSWNIDSLYGTVLVNKTPVLNLDFNSLKIFAQPEKDRSLIRMSPQQLDAATVYGRPTLIIGPAGCGKSVVLTQKVKNILESTKIGNEYNSNIKILLTTFNKELVNSLGDWVEQLLDKGKFTRHYKNDFYGNRLNYSYIQFKNSSQFNIYILHFDVLPTQIGHLQALRVAPNGTDIELFHFDLMQKAIDIYIKTHNINTKGIEKILDPDFLLDEYHRIIYGYECNKEKDYQELERKGRGNNPQLKFNSKRRTIIWGIVRTYLESLKKQNMESFVIRRHKFVKKLRKEGFNQKFTHLLVDEFQDCTRADYEIFYQLLQTPNNLTLAGDIAQSINLGAALHVPRADDQRMGNFSKKLLEGSFRLPFRVSECIKPLSQIINTKFGNREGFQSNIISPYKGAPPGSRPILIYAKDSSNAAMKITEVYNAFKKSLLLDKHKVTIFERDIELARELNQLNTPAEIEIILRTKGLEKHCVVWSTRTKIDTKGEHEEFIYTIFTRTVSLLIIVIFPEVPLLYINILKKLIPERLMRWDEETEIKYQEFISTESIFHEEEDMDTSEDNRVFEEDTLDTLIT